MGLEKSFRPKGDNQGSGRGNAWMDFKGEKRRNGSHGIDQGSRGEAAAKGPGKEARLVVGAPESPVAVEQTSELQNRGFDPETVGGDKSYHTKEFAAGARELGIVPHPASKDGQKTLQVLLTLAHAASQKVRKRIEEIFGWAENDWLLPQEWLPGRRADACPRTVQHRHLESGANDEIDAGPATQTRAGVTPAGPAVCPHTAKRPANQAGRAHRGATIAARSRALLRESQNREAAVSKQSVFQQPAKTECRDEKGRVYEIESTAAKLRCNLNESARISRVFTRLSEGSEVICGMKGTLSCAPDPFSGEIDSFLNYVSLERGLSGNTAAAYQRDLDQAARFLAGLDCAGWQAVKPVHAQQWIHSLTSGKAYAATSLARKLAALRVFSRYLVREEFRTDDFTALLSGPKLKRRVPTTFSREEVARVLAAPIGGTPSALRDRALLELFYSSGLRVSELAQLKLPQVNLEQSFVRIFGKGSKERVVPIGSKACASLRGWMSAGRPHFLSSQTGSHVFLNKSGGSLSRVGLWLIVKKHGKRAGLSKGVKPHALRHSFATHLLSGGADLRAIQEMLGHASISTTQIYTSVEARRMVDHHRKHHPRTSP